MNVAERFSELPVRERARTLLDDGSFREILGPHDHLESPHLAAQGIVPQSDDGAVIARGTIDGVSAVVLGLDGAFQGGGVGEVSGAKVAAALNHVVRDRVSGLRTRVVLLLETGGIRLQEANLGLLAIAEIHAGLVAARQLGPVVGVIAGPVGCFGGMGIAAGLTSHLVMTRGGRLGLNGPEVIETEAGSAELNAADRPLVWSMIGGEQRVAERLAEVLVDDQPLAVAEAVRQVWRHPGDDVVRCERTTAALALLPAVDPTRRRSPAQVAHSMNRSFR